MVRPHLGRKRAVIFLSLLHHAAVKNHTNEVHKEPSLNKTITLFGWNDFRFMVFVASLL